jgi:hypothetical protein
VSNIPFFVLHYKKNVERRAYLQQQLTAPQFPPIYIEDMDAGEFDLDQVYRFDPATFAKVMYHIKDNIIGTTWGMSEASLASVPWSLCISMAEQRRISLEEAFKQYPALRPRPSSPGEVSLCLKHKIAYERILNGGHEYAIIAEDDMTVGPHSWTNLDNVLSGLPADFDYVDLAGGLGLAPRVGNRVTNIYFYEMDPPRPRTTCCAIVRRSLIERMLAIDPPIVGCIDWMLLYVFKLMRAKVYWVEPRVFGHGSQEGAYKSNLAP